MKKIAVTFLACIFELMPIAAQTLSETEVCETMNRAFEFQKAKQYKEALTAFLSVGANLNPDKSEVERQAYVISQTMACSCQYKLGLYEDGYQLAKKLIKCKLEDEEKDDIYYCYTLNGYELACNQLKPEEDADYDKCRELLFEIAPYADGQVKKNVSLRIPLTWFSEGLSHFESQRFDKAFSCFENALNCYMELGLISNAITVLKQLGWMHNYTGHIGEAIANYEQALSLSIQTANESSQMTIAEELLRLSYTIGDMASVAKYTEMIDSIVANTTDDQVKFDHYCMIGLDAQNNGRFQLAEQCFLKGKDLAEIDNPVNKNANKYLIYSKLTDLYLAYKQYNNALQYAELALDEGRKISDTPQNYYWPYYSFAQIYAKMGDRDNCFRSLDSLFMSEPYIEEPRDMSQLYSLRGMCHSSFKEYQSAFDDYKTADDLLATKYPSSDVARLVLFPLLGGMEHKLSHYLESESYYKTYADEIKKIYGEYSLNFIDAQIYLANAQGFANHIEEGCTSYSSAIGKLREIIKKRLPYMNSSEREGFWTPLSSLFTRMTPYALHAGFFQNEYTRTCYDALLLSKAFLLNSERSLYEIVKSEGDEEDMNTYVRIALINERIKSWEKNYVENADSIVAASSRVAAYENILMRTCKSMGDMTSFMDIDYEEVKQALKKNEVLVDFTDFVSYSGDRRYAAYLIKNQQKYPLLLPLFAEAEIDSLGIGRPDMFYSKMFADDVIKILWSPLEKHLKEGTTVYYIPSQMLFQVCLESLPLKDGSLLGEHYNFVRLSSARELMNLRGTDKKADLSAVLYGGLKYDMEPDLMTEKAKQYDLSSLMLMRGDDIVRGKSEFKELPGSKVEVDRISNILERNGFSVRPYIGEEGTEESFMNLHGKSPKILHLATHGFYYTPSEASGVDYLSGYSDAMSLSGLIMSGANSAWKGDEVPEGVLGGVLTANNISRLDLSGTDMVVLSACQSGLGDATSEGLYGLQRAFKKAGVGTMIMTLWNVVDKVTTEFMVNFYESLVENKWDKHKAFNEAKSKLRSKYPDPYYWAAFVMLD